MAAILENDFLAERALMVSQNQNRTPYATEYIPPRPNIPPDQLLIDVWSDTLLEEGPVKIDWPALEPTIAHAASHRLHPEAQPFEPGKTAHVVSQRLTYSGPRSKPRSQALPRTQAAANPTKILDGGRAAFKVSRT